MRTFQANGGVIAPFAPPPPGTLLGLRAKPPAIERFFVNFWKKSYFNAIESQFARVQSHLKALDF